MGKRLAATQLTKEDLERSSGDEQNVRCQFFKNIRVTLQRKTISTLLIKLKQESKNINDVNYYELGL